MRVSDKQGYDAVRNRLQQAKKLTHDSMENLTTQRKLHKASDDPMGVTRLIKNRGELKSITQFKRNIDYAKSFFTKTEETISAMTDSLIRVKELAINAANGVQNSETRAVLSKEVKQIADDLVSLGNARYTDKYIFGGFKTKTAVIDPEGNFLGDDGALFLPIASDSFMQININGRELFQGGSKEDPLAQEKTTANTGVVQTVFNFYDSLVDNNVDGINNVLSELDNHLERVVGYRATLGAKTSTLESVYDRLLSREETLLQDNEEIEGIDFFQTTSDFKRAETVLQSTLLASNKLLQPSLLNFMQ